MGVRAELQWIKIYLKRFSSIFQGGLVKNRGPVLPSPLRATPLLQGTTSHGKDVPTKLSPTSRL